MSEKKKVLIAFLTGAGAAFLICCGISVGFYLLKYRPDRLEYDKLREQVKTGNANLESANALIDSVRTQLSECNDSVSAGLSECTSIRTAAENLRIQVKVLQDYYVSTSSIINKLDNNNCTDKVKEQN